MLIRSMAAVSYAARLQSSLSIGNASCPEDKRIRRAVLPLPIQPSPTFTSPHLCTFISSELITYFFAALHHLSASTSHHLPTSAQSKHLANTMAAIAPHHVPELGTSTSLDRLFETMAGKVTVSGLHYSLIGGKAASQASLLFPSSHQFHVPAFQPFALNVPGSIPLPERQAAAQQSRPAPIGAPLAARPSKPKKNRDSKEKRVRKAKQRECQQLERAGEDAYGRCASHSHNNVLETIRSHFVSRVPDNNRIVLTAPRHTHKHHYDANHPRRFHRHSELCTYEHSWSESLQGFLLCVRHTYKYHCQCIEARDEQSDSGSSSSEDGSDSTDSAISL